MEMFETYLHDEIHMVGSFLKEKKTMKTFCHKKDMNNKMKIDIFQGLHNNNKRCNSATYFLFESLKSSQMMARERKKHKIAKKIETIALYLATC